MDFKVKFFDSYSIAFGEFVFGRALDVAPIGFLNHSKQNKNEEGMGFETRKGLKYFLQKT